jgi:hypothetical protein
MQQKRKDQSRSRKKPNLLDHYSEIGIKAVAASARYQSDRDSRRTRNRAAKRTDSSQSGSKRK